MEREFVGHKHPSARLVRPRLVNSSRCNAQAPCCVEALLLGVSVVGFIVGSKWGGCGLMAIIQSSGVLPGKEGKRRQISCQSTRPSPTPIPSLSPTAANDQWMTKQDKSHLCRKFSVHFVSTSPHGGCKLLLIRWVASIISNIWVLIIAKCILFDGTFNGHLPSPSSQPHLCRLMKQIFPDILRVVCLVVREASNICQPRKISETVCALCLQLIILALNNFATGSGER